MGRFRENYMGWWPLPLKESNSRVLKITRLERQGEEVTRTQQGCGCRKGPPNRSGVLRQGNTSMLTHSLSEESQKVTNPQLPSSHPPAPICPYLPFHWKQPGPREKGSPSMRMMRMQRRVEKLEMRFDGKWRKSISYGLLTVGMSWDFLCVIGSISLCISSETGCLHISI